MLNNTVLSDTVIYYIILTLCLTFTINYFVKLLFKHIDKDPDKIMEYKNIINELTNITKKQDENINLLNARINKVDTNVNELGIEVNKLDNKINKLSKKTYF